MEQEGPSTATNKISGVIHGSAIQAASIEGGLHIHVTNRSGERAVRLEPPRGWEDLPELPGEVRFLLRAQVRAAEELPYRLPGARRPSLATVYVRQDLGSGSEEPVAEQRPAPMLDGNGQLVESPRPAAARLSVRPPSRTVREALDGDDHVVVTGGPGQGKSTLSLRLAADVAARWLSEDTGKLVLTEPVVPLRVAARELAARLGLPFPEAVTESVCAEYGALLRAPLDARVMGERVVGCRWLLLVDGLDEVADSAERDRLVAVLATWTSDTESPYRVVLTTRPIEGGALAPLQRIGAARYELLPFDEDALRRFAETWFDVDDDANRFVHQIRAAHLDELVRVPLLATIAAIIFEQYGDRPLPDNQYELYESYLKYLRSARHLGPSRFDPTCDALLEHLGRVRLEADTSLVGAAREWAVRYVQELEGDWYDELTTYLAAVGPFVHQGNDLRFLHHSFAEHLAATAKARLLPVRFEPEHSDFAHLLHAARAEERGRHARAVLLHHTRLRTAEADRLIAWLHAGDAEQHLLAARLLALHVPAGVAVVDVFLSTVRAWAMSTRYPADEILAQAGRATHHPGIARWLTDLTCDKDAPWSSRIEAATALATRLRGAEAAEALALLRAVVDDATAAVEHRLAAAEALAECGRSERNVAERGLRSVLADLAADAYDRRKAAVVLAGFDGAARACAVEALTTMLDEPWTPDSDLVEAATGLAEIGIEFHARCTEVFRAVLHRRTFYNSGLRNAAIGWASLGSQHLADAITALTNVISDRRLERVDRLSAASALAELGPQQRAEAAEHLSAIADEVDISPMEKWAVAEYFVRIGLHRRAAEQLEAVLAVSTTTLEIQLLAARTFADLGPDHTEETAQLLRRVVDCPMAAGHEHATAFGRLAALGGSERASAVAALLGVLANRNADPIYRCHAASELIQLGPEFHREAGEHTLEIASKQADPLIRVRAWRTMKDLGVGFRDQASAALLELMGPGEAEAWAAYRDYPVPNESDTDDHESMASVLTAVLGDPARSGATRSLAASALLDLGRAFHPIALDGLLKLLRSQALPPAELPRIAKKSARLACGARAVLADALRALASPSVTGTTVSRVAEALDLLGHQADPEVTEILRCIVADDGADPDERSAAAVALARAVPEEMGDVVARVLRCSNGDAFQSWESHVRQLADLGADIAPGLRALLSDADTKHRERRLAAVTVLQLHADVAGVALSELRAAAQSEFQEFLGRTITMLALVEFDPDALDHAVAFHRAVLDNEREPIEYRSVAACQLARLDQSSGDVVFATLRRLATSLELSVEERGWAVYWLSWLAPRRSDEVIQLGLSVVRDPAATPPVRSRLRRRLWGRGRLEVERSLLADHAASPNERIGDLTEWEHPALAKEAEAALRDVITAAETLPTERVEAAAALATLSPRHIPEAVRLLEELAAGPCAASAARDELAKLGPACRHRMLADAEHLFVDENCSSRQRRGAALTILNLTAKPPEPVVEHLRAIAREGTSDTMRVEIIYALRKLYGLSSLREIRDDERARQTTRWLAAKRLREHAVEDRAAGMRALKAVATDATCRPALRWRAARDLTKFGARGRELGVAALEAVIADDASPLLTRVHSACALGTIRPDLRLEALRFLRQHRTVENPLARVQVLRAIGQFDTVEAVLALQEMTRDRSLNPGCRLRAADAVAELRRDYRERAAVAAREVAHDEKVPWHIRVKAARALARWSELCRPEARALLVKIRARP